MPATGHPHTTLIVIRGNSGSGKSTIARELRRDVLGLDGERVLPEETPAEEAVAFIAAAAGLPLAGREEEP
jgi:hypothetical protein